MQHNVQPTHEPQRAVCGARRPGWENGPAIGRHRIPCVLEHGHAGDHRNALGKSWPVDEHAAARPSVVVPLLDAPGATLTASCPEWCTDSHATDMQRGVLAADFTHHGTRQDLPPGEDGAPVLSVRIEQWPFASAGREPFAALWSACGQVEDELTPDGVYAFAVRLRAFASALDALGVELDDARRSARLDSR
jgi:hypothetical protein